MKRRCYERGAEDNLTAVVVRVGNRTAAASNGDDESTLVVDDPALHDTLHDTLPGAVPNPKAAPQPSTSGAGLTPASRIAFPATVAPEPATPPAAAAAAPAHVNNSAAAPPPPQATAPPRRSGSLGRALLTLLLIAGVGAAAFFAGRYQAQQELTSAASANRNASAAPTPSPLSAEAEFDKRRREVDRDPAGSVTRMETETNNKPFDSTDPEFLYLYGRALLLSNRHEDASRAFKLAIEKLKDRPSRDSLKVEAKLAAAVAALRSGNWTASQAASKDLEEVFEMVNKTVTQPLSNTGSPFGVSNMGESAPSPQQ
jgi:hypothetical protein